MWIQNNSNQTAEEFSYGNLQNSDGNEGKKYTEQFAEEWDCRDDTALLQGICSFVCLSVCSHACIICDRRHTQIEVRG